MSSGSGNSKQDGKINSSKIPPPPLSTTTTTTKQQSNASTSKDVKQAFVFGGVKTALKQKAQQQQQQQQQQQNVLNGKSRLNTGKTSGATLEDFSASLNNESHNNVVVVEPPPPEPVVAIPLNILDLPENVTENLFTFLPLPDLRTCALVCSEWNRILSDENNDVWRAACYRRLSRETLHSELLASCPTYKSKLRALFHSWNPHDCSRNVFVKPSGFTIHRNPVAQSTDGARGRIGFTRGRHAWEIVWEGPLGTVAVVGLATRQAEMRAQGYVALLGQDEHSWGWNLVENILLHNGDSQGNYPLINNAPRYQVGEKIRVILDCDDNTLSFEKNFEFLGVAFRGLPKQELFPSISAVYGNTEVSMVYLGPPLDG